MEGVLFKMSNGSWVVVYQPEDTNPYVYLLYPGSVVDDSMSGKEVKFEVVDGYAKLIN